MVYFGAGKCRKISGLSAEQLEKTCNGRTLETPNKPKVRCVHTPLHSESIKFYPINTKNSDDTYLKIDPDFKYTHHLCHNGKLVSFSDMNLFIFEAKFNCFSDGFHGML